MAKQEFPEAKKISPVYQINGALYTRKTSGEAMGNPEAIRARVVGDDGVERVAWFTAALECAPDEDEDEATEADQPKAQIAKTA